MEYRDDVTETSVDTIRDDFTQVGKTILFYVALQLGFALALIFLSEGLSSWSAGMLQIANLLIVVVVSSLTLRRGMKKLDLRKQDLKLQRSDLGIGKILSYMMLGIGLSMLGSIVVMIINSLVAAIQGIEFVGPDFSMSGDVTYDITMIIMVLVGAPMFEELIFRGVILRSLARYDRKFAIIVSGILFGMMHMNLVQGIPTMLFGFVLAYVCIKSGSIIPSIVIHFLNNFISLSAGFILNNETMIMLLGLMEITFMIYAITKVIRYKRQFQMEFATPSDTHYYKYFFNTWPIIVFIVLVVVSTLTSFAVV